MSAMKRRANVVTKYSSSEESASNDPRDLDFEDSLGSRSPTERSQESTVSRRGSNGIRPRGRATSKQPCLNRNALLARENRQRKKEYMEKIENKLSFYRQENKNLTNVIQRQDVNLKRLKGEVSYLRSVLNNSSSITNLLKSMNDTLSAKRMKNDICYDNNEEQRRKLCDNSMSNSCWLKGKQIHETSSKHFTTGSLRRDGSGGKRAESIKTSQMRTHDSDHTYTSSSRDGSLDNDENSQYYGDSDENDLNMKRNNRTLGELPERCLAMDCNDIGLPNLGIFDIEHDELLQFDANIFEPLGNCNNEKESVDNYFDQENDKFNESGNLFENLENSGICLHVNSGKVSLEFCSICRLNSINSSE